MSNDLLDKVQAELDTYRSLGLSSVNTANLIEKWRQRVSREPARLINDTSRLDPQVLRNFRNLNIYLEDWPHSYGSIWKIRNPSAYVATRRWLIDCLKVLKESGYDYLLKKYPCDAVGNPATFRYSGYIYTYRWLKHIYYLGLMKKTLGNLLGSNFNVLDLGSGWGIFSSLVKKEFAASHHILVDFPEALLLAYYFLGSCFPGARIAGIKEVQNRSEISRDFIEQYDFVLIPATLYSRLKPDTADLYTNFVSLGEMKREWFEFYLKSPTFLTSKYFYTVNRVISQPTYETDITLIDYIQNKQKKMLHFAIHPLPSWMDQIRFLFLCKKASAPPIFEYICEI